MTYHRTIGEALKAATASGELHIHYVKANSGPYSPYRLLVLQNRAYSRVCLEPERCIKVELWRA